MLNFILPILKNPLTRMIGQKVIGGIQHKIEKDKIIKVREIEALKDVNVAQVEASNNSWKDEYLTLIFGLILVAHFLPFTQDYMERGWNILKNADPLFWYSVLAIISGSFGMNLTNKLKGKK